MIKDFTVQNLKCGGCANTIKGKLMQLDSVNGVEIDVERSFVQVDINSVEDGLLVEKTLTHLGYPLEGTKNELTTKAKSLVSCAIGKMNS